jgi:hypothetical protein
MNEAEFKRHLKDLVHGHHHPEKHDSETRPETEHNPAKSGGNPQISQKK